MTRYAGNPPTASIEMMSDGDLLDALFETRAEAENFLEEADQQAVREFTAELAASYARATKRLKRASKKQRLS